MHILEYLSAHPVLAFALLGVALVLLVISVIVAFTETKEDDAWLAKIAQRISALNPANIPGLLSMPGLAPSPSNAKRDALVTLAIGVIAALLAGGCAGRAHLAAETTRATVCVQVESQCIDRAEAGQITVREAEACVSCARSTCDAIRERLAAQ